MTDQCLRSSALLLVLAAGINMPATAIGSEQDLTPGRSVAVSLNEQMHAGEHSIAVDAGNPGSGLYYCSLTAGTDRQTKTMLSMK